jgi:integrase
MARRRVNGEGTITKLSNGTYMGKVMIGWKSNGKPNRISIYGKTEKEVSAKIREISSKVDNGSYIMPTKLTFGDWLIRWLHDYKSINLKPRTYDTYESQINTHIIPEIGGIELKNLKAPQIQQLYNKLYRNGKGLSSATIRKIHSIISSSLKQAQLNDLIYKNPAIGLELPSHEQKPIRAFTHEEQERFFFSAKGSMFYNALIFAFDTGVRMNELLALTWDDIDLKNGFVTINKTLSYVINRKKAADKKYDLIVTKPKTKASNRKIPLTSRLQKLLIEMKLRNKKVSNLVFPSKSGGYIDPSNFQRTFRSVVKKAGIEKCSCHILRHTFATRCFEKGIPAKIVSKWLGHSKVGHTLDIYTHVMPDFEKEAIHMLESKQSF